ncbi:MAG: tetratricopeptide repeat protein [Bacteroidota bacterium]
MTRSMRRVLRFLMLGMLVQCGVAQTPTLQFERANELYRDGAFDQAAETYEAILGEGVASPELYFNLGNTYYRMGRIAPAILAYERARRLAPGDPEIRHNLDLANLRTLDRIDALPELFFLQWHRSVSSLFPLQTTFRVFLICWVLFFASLALFYLLSQDTILRIARWLTLSTGLLLLPLGGLVITQYLELQSRNDAIVTSPIATAKTSPDTQSVDAFVVHEGLKVTVGDALGEWVKITLADGKVGWILSRECERI